MILLAFVVGTILPTLCGWLLLRNFEGSAPVLLRLERWTLGFLLGLTGTMFLSFIATVTVHLPLSRIGFLAIQIGTLIVLALILRLRKLPLLAPSPKPSTHKTPRWAVMVMALLLAWTAVKVIVGGWSLVTLPPYFDDTFKNWNLRGKIFFVTKQYTVSAPGSDVNLVGQLHAYPPAVPLAKAWYASLAGTWDEGLVDSVHLLWFLAALGLLYSFLRRHLSFGWAAFGVYLLASLPLFLVHGTQAYADVFLAAHLFAVVSLLYHAISASDEREHSSFLHLSALALALLVFTKNEGTVLYLPILLAITAAIFFMLKRSGAPMRTLRKNALWILVSLLVVAVPWLLFKWTHGLTFGNAKAITDTTLFWDPRAPLSIAVILFFEGNWLLFPALFAVLLFLARKKAFSSPILLLTSFVLLGFLAQLPIFLVTNLATEAVMGTGYARGLLHLLPVACAAAVLLLASLLDPRHQADL